MKVGEFTLLQAKDPPNIPKIDLKMTFLVTNVYFHSKFHLVAL